MTATKTFKVIRPAAKPQAAPAAPQPKPGPADPVAKLAAIEAWANTVVVGRGPVVRLLLLALVGGQNCLFLGPPGTAKTMLVERLAATFTDRVFSTLFTKFSKPIEVFGPLSLRALKNDEVHHDTDGFLPWAVVAILDELFKGSSAICNSTLSVANERRFRNGKAWEPTPTRMIVGMSNEFPEDPATLAAFFDRFPIKAMVKYVEGTEFEPMLKAGALNGAAPKAPCNLSPQDLAELDGRMAACQIPQDVFDAVSGIRDTLNARGVVISDRRYVQALRLLKASAVLEGRAKVSKTDLKVLEAVCWNSEQDIAVIRTILPDYLNPLERELKEITDEVYAERAKVLAAGNYDGADKARPVPDNVAATQQAAKSLAAVRGIRSKIDIIADMVESDDDHRLMDEATKSISGIDETIRAVALGKAALDQLKETEGRDLAGA